MIDVLVVEVIVVWGLLYVFVNNGGVCFYMFYDEIDFDEWDLVFEINVCGMFFLICGVFLLF